MISEVLYPSAFLGPNGNTHETMIQGQDKCKYGQPGINGNAFTLILNVLKGKLEGHSGGICRRFQKR
jgi:hypothetical protein